MAATAPSKKSAPLKSLLLSSNKMTNHFKEWKAASGVLKKIHCLYKNLMPQIDPLNSSFSQKVQ